jgi:hypothetical protein
MSSYTITTTDEQDRAIAFVAGNPNVDKQAYVSACVMGQLIEPWENQYQAATALAEPAVVGQAYLDASPAEQQAVLQILGVTATREAPAA